MSDAKKATTRLTLKNQEWASDAEIQRGVPMPPAKARYRFDLMEVGDSMFFDDLRAMESAFSASRAYAKRSNPKFKLTSRKFTDDSYGLWRIK